MSDPLHLSSPRPRFLQSRRAVAGSAILICISLMAIFAPWLTPYDPFEQHLADRRQPPSVQHPFGLDELGRDNLSRVIHGARLSLRVGVTSVLLAVAVGTPMGAIAGYSGRLPDALITALIDVMLTFPTLLLAISVIAILGRGLSNALYAVAIAQVPSYARLARVSVLSIKGKDYVLAAQAVGVSPGRLLCRHILPGCLGPLQTQAALGIGTAILEAAGLSFLGLGAQPPTPEWGAMIAQGRGAVLAAPHIVLFPGLAIMLAVLGFNLLGDGLRETTDPRLWSRVTSERLQGRNGKER
jgi:peptide/nickel transport system permease protein